MRPFSHCKYLLYYVYSLCSCLSKFVVFTLAYIIFYYIELYFCTYFRPFLPSYIYFRVHCRVTIFFGHFRPNLPSKHDPAYEELKYVKRNECVMKMLVMLCGRECNRGPGGK